MRKYILILLAIMLCAGAIDVEAKKKKRRPRKRQAPMEEIILPESANGLERDEVFENTEYIYDAAEVMPKYPGGVDALVRFISDNLQYPEQAEKDNIQGKVLVQFVVERNGKIGRIKIARSSGDRHLDNEALRVVSIIPRFEPATIGGKPVACWFTLPISFKLPEDSPSQDE